MAADDEKKRRYARRKSGAHNILNTLMMPDDARHKCHHSGPCHVTFRSALQARGVLWDYVIVSSREPLDLPDFIITCLLKVPSQRKMHVRKESLTDALLRIADTGRWGGR